jgi:soluble lytic murein transglycosylase-like protein
MDVGFRVMPKGNCSRITTWPDSAHGLAGSWPDSIVTKRAGTGGLSNNVEHFMRACVLALAVVAFAQPAYAASSHKAHKRHHHAAAAHHHGAAHHRHHARVTRVRREAPIISGYAMPKSFDEAPAQPWQQPAWQSQQASAGAPVRQHRIARAAARNTALDAAIARHAAANGLPVELVHRVVKRESNYNPRASSKGNIGLMQIRYQTARGVGYGGSPSGLLDAETNLTYAVKYLAGAYRAAGGSESRAVALYASGYHGRGVSVTRRARVERVADAGWGAQASDAHAAPVSMGNPVRMKRRARR